MQTQTIEPSQNSTASLFIGLQSYTEGQSDIFYGRDEETDRLTNLIKANTLTIVFGKSGTGKTSLLNAGVFPRLRKDYCLPFRIRLEFLDDSPDLITQIKNILQSEIDKYGFKVEAYPSTETLWEYFHSEQLWKSITPILIFDQFEEIFTLAKRSDRFGNEQLVEFWEELADLIENSIPERLKEKFLNDKEQIDYSYKNQKIKILFSFREEFLPEFEGITSKIPSIKYSRFRLLPMNGNQAYEVITKTWKNAIDAEQANKIVAFFTNEKDKNKSYDVMEIEASLLSQVCSYLDKERISAGGDKISSEFLNKYPKDKILRSIYDEVLTESNTAVNRNDDGIKKIAKPVNEFVEDKLITDEGYRTKYTLNENDEKVRPGIEVLKSKYFIRDDGKSVELTHDVLAPLIKEDREERRKEISEKIEAAKARKRYRLIIIGVLFLSLLVSAMIWFFTTKKARKDKEIAEKQTVQMKKSIKDSSIKLDSIKKQLSTYTVNKNDTNQVQALLKKQVKLDSTISALNQKVEELTAHKNVADSMSNEFRQTTEAFTKLKQDSIASQNVYAQLNNKYTALQNDFDNLKNDNTTLKSKNDKLSADNDRLKGELDDYKSKKAAASTADVQPSPPADNNSLRLNLYSSKNQDIPGNLVIFLVPDVAANKKVIKDSKIHDNHYDFANLRKAQGAKTAVFKDNVYSFPDVDPGDYFIKICANYGPYKMVTKKAAGNETGPKIDFSEIIK